MQWWAQPSFNCGKRPSQHHFLPCCFWWHQAGQWLVTPFWLELDFQLESESGSSALSVTAVAAEEEEEKWEKFLEKCWCALGAFGFVIFHCCDLRSDHTSCSLTLRMTFATTVLNAISPLLCRWLNLNWSSESSVTHHETTKKGNVAVHLLALVVWLSCGPRHWWEQHHACLHQSWSCFQPWVKNLVCHKFWHKIQAQTFVLGVWNPACQQFSLFGLVNIHSSKTASHNWHCFFDWIKSWVILWQDEVSTNSVEMLLKLKTQWVDEREVLERDCGKPFQGWTENHRCLAKSLLPGDPSFPWNDGMCPIAISHCLATD